MSDDALREALPFSSGQIVGGKYRVERVVGQGGMGIVAEAVHIQLDERVALKFLRPEMLALPDVVARFDREARAAVKLKSEHVARVVDVGKTDAGVPFMVMEYLEGQDLAEVLSTQGPLSVSHAVEYIIQACEGIGEAHSRGIVHRDVKPENLFLLARSDGWRSIKVLDFGISKTVLLGASSVDMASHETHSIMGSPYYMSPEQLRSTKSVDHRADVWSLGIVLFELLTGVMPFDETREFTELVAAVLETPHRRLTDFRFDVPEGLEAVVDKCLQKDRAARFQNTAELAVALLPFAPKRARVMVERATSFSKAAGLSDPTFQMPPSEIPPPTAEAYLPIGSLLAPRVPAMTPTGSTSPPLTSSSMSGPIEIKKSPRLLIGGIALLALGATAAFAVIRLTHTTPSSVATQTAASIAAPTTIAPAVITTSAKRSRRVFVVEPRDAVVMFDGAHVPMDTQWLEGTHSALLHVEAPGRASRDQTVSFDSDDPVVVRLEVLPTAMNHGSAHVAAVVASAAPSASVAASASASVAPPPPPPPTVNPTDVGY